MKKYFNDFLRFFKLSDNSPKESDISGISGISGISDISGATDRPATDKLRGGRNITAKILAVFIAVGLWLYVMNEQNPAIEARYTVPLEIRNVQANYVVTDYPGDVRVKVRGPRGLIAGTSHKDIVAYVDMTNLSDGRHSVGVRANVPSTLELVESSPETVIVHLEPIIARAVPITVEFRGVLPKNIIISRVNAKLAEATVKGPKHIVDTVDKLLGTIDVTGKEASFAADVPLVPLGRTGSLVEGVTVSPQVTPVQVDIEHNVIKKTVEVKPVFGSELPQGITLRSISFAPAKVELKDPVGSGTVIEKTAYVYTDPINLSEISRDTDKIVKLTAPEGLTVTPEWVTAHIKVSK